MLPLPLLHQNRNRTLPYKQKLNPSRSGAVGRANGLRLEPLEERQRLAVFTVNTTSDIGARSSGSLRWTVKQANANPGLDKINLSLSGTSTVTLNSSLGSLPAIGDAVTFNCKDGGTIVTIDGSQLGGAHHTTGLQSEGTGTSVAHTVVSSALTIRSVARRVVRVVEAGDRRACGGDVRQL